jgi:hypothetical protein
MSRKATERGSTTVFMAMENYKVLDIIVRENELDLGESIIRIAS